MASDRPPSRNQPRRQSIPLQDLSRPPDPTLSDSRRGHTRSVSERAKAFINNRQSIGGRVGTAYERVDEGSPPAHDRSHLDLPHITTPRNTHQALYNYEDGEVSPVNVGDFQAAMGSVGLSFESLGSSKRPAISGASSARASTLNIIAEGDGVAPFFHPDHHTPNENDNDNFFSPTDDSTPLTDSRYLQPISGAQAPTLSGQRHDRQNSAFSFQERSSPGSRLGDDLPNAEAGGLHRSGTRALRRLSSQSLKSASRSLSVSAATSPLSRAGSMVRKMSQRVVNLTNEPEIVEQTIRRQPSSKQARLDEPPSFPAMVEYAHDEPSGTPRIEIEPKVGFSEGQWPKPPNPLKGRSLLIFAPDNWLRRNLCEMLVHPVTEPVILVLIVLQTILLAVDSASDLQYMTRPEKWQDSKANFAMLVLFLLYTLEIAVKIIVSGLIKNPAEYSTVNGSQGFQKTFIDRCRALFVPSRQPTAKGGGTISNADGLQPSILRSFTGVQDLADQSGNSRQQQRVRLARRAFLRHSFNRLDFLAVVSFWVSFVISILQIEAHQHVYVFRMLSCLRILRLLSLTSGTSVSFFLSL